MDKKNIHRFFLGLLLSASILSFAFLCTVPTTSGISASVEVKKEHFEEKETREGGAHLPDVALLKKMFDTARRFIPAY